MKNIIGIKADFDPFRDIMVYRTKTRAESAYYESLVKHRKNIFKLYDAYGRSLCNTFKVNLPELEILINKHDLSKVHNDQEREGFMFYHFRWENDNLDENELMEKYSKAVRKHRTSNTHHYEHFIDIMNNPREIPMINILEMVLDWLSLAPDFNIDFVLDEWNMNKNNIEECIDERVVKRYGLLIHPESKINIEKVLNELKELLKYSYLLA